MKRKAFGMIVLAGVTAAASSVALGDSSGVRIVVPMPPPTSRPSDSELSAVSGAQQSLEQADRDAGVAYATLIRAQANLDRVTHALQIQMETSGPMTAAMESVASAKAAYDQAAEPVLAVVTDRSLDREARAALVRAQQEADQVRARANATTQERIAAAQAVLDAKVAVAQLENAALDGNSDVANTKKNYVDATQRLKEMRMQAWQALHQDPAYLEARRSLDDARERLISADLQVSDARQALYASQRQIADKQESRQQIVEWVREHGLPEPP
jgi:hypothetical protein